MFDPTKRFTKRVGAYVQARPTYPPEVIDTLRDDYGLSPQDRVADVGSGTGILTAQLLDFGCRVWGIEPNDAMRRAAEERFADSERFTSVKGQAEATSLPDSSVDWVTVGQAFHWFRVDETRTELRRILIPEGRVALVWNLRSEDASPFLVELEQLLLDRGIEYRNVKAKWQVENAIPNLYAEHRLFTFNSNRQVVDLDGLKGRLLSSSYFPQPEHPSFPQTIAIVEDMYKRHQVDDRVSIEYKTILYVGGLKP